MFCTKCGSRVPEEGRFCPICGTAIENAPIKAPQQPVQAPPVYVPVHEQTPKAPYMQNQYVPYSQPVQQPIPQPVQQPAPQPIPQPAAPKKKKKTGLWVGIVVAVVVVALIAVALVFLLGEQTVYLMTKQVTVNGGTSVEYGYAYDEDGRITSYTYRVESEYYESELKVSYTYDDDGKLEKAVVRVEDEKVTIHYEYEKNVLADITVDSENLDGITFDVKCNSDGTIRTVTQMEDGEEIYRYSFKYHENGVLKKSTCERNWGNQQIVTEYTEDGKVLQYAYYYGEECVYRMVYAYDSKGNQTLQEYYTEGEELEQRIEFQYTYLGDTITDLKIEMEAEEQRLEIDFDLEWDGRECTMTVESVDGDQEVIDGIDGEPEDLEIKFEIDKAGNVLGYEVIFEDEVQNSVEREYEAFSLPRGYKQPNVNVDPLYILFLINS